MAAQKEKGLSVTRNIKIGFFHLGSGMADILITSVWNRVMISDLGFSATPVSILASLRYFLAPLGIWAGRKSDTQRMFGFRRLFWIWLGRALMVISTFALGFATAELVKQPPDTAHLWILIVVAMTLFSLGNALSGSTFLSLIYDRSTDEQRGRAVGIVWTFLLLGYTVGGVFFSIMLPRVEDADGLSFTANDLLMLFVVSGVLFLALWFFSLWGEEQRSDNIISEVSVEQSSMREDLALVWQHPSMRFFLFFLTISMFFAFSQDAILEPYAGDVFDMEARITNRFSAYWGSTAIAATVFFLWLARKRPNWTNTRMSWWGVVSLFFAFLIFAVSSLFEIRSLVTPGLLLLGIGLGIWNVGTLGLMMDMSPLGRAGTFLGFWSMSVTLARGGGIATGGILRDVGLQATNSSGMAYGIVFGMGAVGLLIALYCLRRIHVEEFKSEMSAPDAETVFAGSLD